MIVDPASAPVSGGNGLTTRELSVAGGLTQFGAYLDRLDPGAWSSLRHWHSAEDEFLFVLTGHPTLRDDHGLTDLAPGDALTWRQGDPNAHHLTNRGDAPCEWLIVGSRAAGDICTYPDDGRRQVNEATTWRVETLGGEYLRGGDLPAALLDLPAPWGKPFDGRALPNLHREAGRPWVDEVAYAHPMLGGGLGDYRHCVLGDAGGLSQFGAHLEELPPGSRSSFRHWHEAEDEAILVLSGHPTLIEDGETRLKPGDMACWPAGTAIGHQLHNRTDAPAVYLTLGTRLARDRIHYPDHDLITEKDGPARRYAHADGRPRKKGDFA
ncbi:MAG: cupin domain-containing protein [Paracoccaceae bacterium]